ncbi:DUF397 domain-containing protein [Saccharothrix coeruleofusca]|uniref:DUF397 domain-containing protein n=1 Tax=Saccharothrix coeruleofusca TaxID=33919 RepID=UPI001AE72555|nr:DUF397 domain-containing protein [Saccharothrix coeruleofusca]
MWSEATALRGARWRKSSYTSGGNDPQCVELACLAVGTAVRDSKAPAGPVLVFPGGAFEAFLGQAAAGRFDRR